MSLLRLPRTRTSIFALSLLVAACSDDGGGNNDDGEKPDDMSQDPASAGDLGKGDGHDVVAIGDSWMKLTDTAGIQQSLNAASGQTYRTYGIPGTCILPGHCLLGGTLIPDQYTQAKAENAEIKTVVMTAGGNDILQDFNVSASCGDESFDAQPACKNRVDEIAVRLQELWAEMSKDGVRDVIIVGYTRKAKLFLSGASLTKVSEYTASKIPPLCEAVPAPLRCHALDADMVVPDLALRSDNIHPDDASYVKLGQAVFELMEEKGMRR
jgi:hypothetical protein